jgi:alpha-methylacyl-CoA racemase
MAAAPADAPRPAETAQTAGPAGPLAGIRVIEIAGLGPTPYTGMLLSDMGADVIRVDRPGSRPQDGSKYALSRGRRSIVVDLKQSDGAETVLALADRADALLEGYRPGVAERLGFGPEVCLARNPRLVYGRMTGWGNAGPLSQAAGHDLNYLGLTGALTLLQRRPNDQPVTPPGLLADFAGGGLMLAFGVVCALLEAARSGQGQVIDAAMVDGVASLTTLIYSMAAQGRYAMDLPGSNFCDGGAPYYDTYETADHRWLAVAALEPQFYSVLLGGLGLDPADVVDREEPANWPALRKTFTEIFRSRTRAAWLTVFDGTDACVTPVLSFSEAVQHPHNAARGTFVEEFGVLQPAPAPRLSRTPAMIAGPPPLSGEHSEQILTDWGFDRRRIDELLTTGTVLRAASGPVPNDAAE